MKKQLLIVSILCFSFLTEAQEPGNLRSVGLFGTGGVHYFSNISPINDALKAEGLPVLLNHVPAYHAGINYSVNRFLFQFSEREYELPVKTKGQFELSATGEGYEIKFGYDLLANPKVDLTPYVGLGAHEILWRIDRGDPVELKTALNTLPQYSYQLSVKDEQIASIGMILNFHMFSFSRDQFDFFLGGNVHYLFSDSGRWYLNNQLINIDNVDLGGLSFMVNIEVQVNLSNIF